MEKSRDAVYGGIRQRVAWAQHLVKVGLRVSKERARVQAMGRHIPPGSVVLDVGAHLGYLTKEFARLHDGTCQVIAFEPIAYTHSILSIVCRRRRNVRIEKVALSDRLGSVDMRIPLKDSGTLGIGLSHFGEETERDYVVETVQTTTLDAFFKANPDIGRVRFIKADIEGAEAVMLAGAVETLQRDRPVLYLEMGRCDPMPILSSLGYEPFGMAEDGTVRQPRDDDHDLLFVPA